MASSIRYCPPIRCRPDEPIRLHVEGFQSNPERGCSLFFSVIGQMPGTGFFFGNAQADSTNFTGTEPGKYVIRVLCCCRPPNG